MTDLSSLSYFSPLACAFVLIFGFAFPLGAVATFVERRVAGFFQDRPGPNRVGPFGVLQFIADGIKMMSKQDALPKDARAPLIWVGVTLLTVGVFSLFAIIPWSPNMSLVTGDLTLVYLLALGSFVPPAIFLAGWGSGSHYSFMGGTRATIQILSYELPLGLSLITAVMTYQSTNLWHMTLAQDSFFEWGIFQNPFMFVALIITFVCALAEANRTPFDFAEAESELVSGYHTELSGIRFGVFALTEFSAMFVLSGLIVALFLGGWHFPFLNHFIPWGPQKVVNINSALRVIQFWPQFIWFSVFMAKLSCVVFVMMWIRWTLPRYRPDQMMALCWKALLPLALINLLGTGIWMTVFHGKNLAKVLGL